MAAAAALRQLPGLERESEERLVQLATQERSLAELYCSCFAGTATPTPLKPFLLLGRLILLDHLEALGYAAPVAEALTTKRSLNQLMHTAVAFGVRTEPGITSSRQCPQQHEQEGAAAARRRRREQ